MENRPHWHRQTGFTLLEMMVTVTVVGILLAVGVPSFRYMANMNRVAAEANNLLGDIQFARSEAIKEGQSVVVCPSSTYASSTPSCTSATATDWSVGWIVFSDVNGNGAFGTGDILLRASNKLSSSDTLTSSIARPLIFNREGFAGGLTAAQYFILHTPVTGNQWTRCVMVGIVGSASVVKYDGTNCT